MESSFYSNTYNRSKSNLNRYSRYDSFENTRNFRENNLKASSLINSRLERLKRERRLPSADTYYAVYMEHKEKVHHPFQILQIYILLKIFLHWDIK